MRNFGAVNPLGGVRTHLKSSSLNAWVGAGMHDAPILVLAPSRSINFFPRKEKEGCWMVLPFIGIFSIFPSQGNKLVVLDLCSQNKSW